MKTCSSTIGDSSYRLNFDLDKKNKIQQEHRKVSKIAKFSREML